MIIRELERGSRTYGLLDYLYGPGRANEHTNQHMVGAWDPGVKDPAMSSETNLDYLAMLLDMPVHAMRAKKLDQHVWHGVIALDDGDRQLTDAEWRQAATEAIEAAGLASPGDPSGCRWVAVKHADDHVHLVATLARQDGTRATSGSHMKNNFFRMQEKAAELEVRYGLHIIPRNLKDQKARRTPAPTRGETEKARRNQRPETPRETLAARVRQVAALSRSEEEFFAGVQRAGLRLNIRADDRGRALGYSVALPGDRTGQGRAIYYSGSKLGPDLSLPRVRERWSAPLPTPATPQVASRGEAWQFAAEHVHAAAAVLGQAGREAAAGELAALSDLLTTLAADSPRAARDELRAVARAFELAGRADARAARRLDSTATGHLRTATRLLVAGAGAAAGGTEAAAALALLIALALAVAAAVRWYQMRQLHAQAAAALQAGQRLHQAVEVLQGATRSPGSVPRPRLPRTTGDADHAAAYEAVVRQVLPRHAERILSEDAWPALAATLRTVEHAGHDAARALADVAAIRDFGDAQSVAEVLVWRLQRHLDQDLRIQQSAGVLATATATAAGSAGTALRPATVRTATAGDSPPEEPLPPLPPVVRGPQISPADPDQPIGPGDDAPTFAAVLRQAVPEHADAVLADPASRPLASRLSALARTGQDPAEVLSQVARARELHSADSVAEVLSWRLAGRTRQDTATGPLTRPSADAPRQPENPPSPSRSRGEQSAAQRAAQEAARRRNNPGGPRR